MDYSPFGTTIYPQNIECSVCDENAAPAIVLHSKCVQHPQTERWELVFCQKCLVGLADQMAAKLGKKLVDKHWGDE